MKQLILSFFFLHALSLFAQQDTTSLYFEVDAYRLTAKHLEQLDELRQRQPELLFLEAHCDTSGSVHHNDVLSQNRLTSVLEKLDLPGLPVMNSYGERKAGEARDYRAEQFRRVDIIYKIPVIASGGEEVTEVETVQEEVVPMRTAIEQFLADSLQKEVTIQLTILFYNASGAYLPESEPELQALLRFMQDFPNMTAHIRGHICCQPYMEWDGISEARSRTVADYLIDRGVARSRISNKGYGSSRPFRDPELTEEDRKLNRRVDVIFTKH